MSNSNDSDSTLRTFLRNGSTLVLAVISFITSIYGFVKLFGDKDAGLVTIVSLSVGILLLLAICLYYARFWQPEKQDKGRSSAFEPPLSDQQVKAQTQKEQRRGLIRRSAAAGLILVPILSISSVTGWQYYQSLPTKDNIILVADFDGPDPKQYRVTDTIFNELHRVAEKYPDVKVLPLNRLITEQEGSEVARTEGKRHKATIVIWGWYGNTGEAVPLSVHFEVLHPPKEFPELGQNFKGQVQTAAIAELTSFTLQPRLSTELSALSLFTLGVTRFSLSDSEGAIALLNDALSQSMAPSSKIDPSFIYFYRGTAYLQKGDLDRAFSDLNQAIKLQPNFAEAYGNRLLIYLAKGEYDHALADANQLLKLKPDFAIGYNDRGLIYVNKGNYNQAISDFTLALKFLPDSNISSNPNRSEGNPIFSDDYKFFVSNQFFWELGKYLLYSNRGTAYYVKGDLDHALADFNQAIQLQPNFALAYYNRGTVYFAKHDYNRALVELNRAIQIQPSALSYLMRGDIYDKKEDYDRALADLNQAIQLQPNFVLAYGVRGEIYVHKGDYDRALTDFNQALKFQSNMASLYQDRGIAYSKKGDHDHAIADFTQAIKLEPDNAEFYDDRGISYEEQGDYDHAIADYNQALKLQPNNALAYNDRGYAYAEKGSYDQALTDVNRAIQLQPNEATFYDTRGLAYAGKGDYDRAIADYNHALKLKPDADYAYYHRALVYQKRGEQDRAIADLKRTLELTKDPERHQDAEKRLSQM